MLPKLGERQIKQEVKRLEQEGRVVVIRKKGHRNEYRLPS